jgi:hypothetical protein
MTGLELLEKNPNVAKLICSYYLEIMLESLKDEGLPEEFKDSVREQGIDNYKIGAIIDGNPRNLLEFFDNKGIFINVTRYIAGDGITYSILDNNSSVKSSRVFHTRKEADKVGLELAIEKLEEALTKSVSDKENG